MKAIEFPEVNVRIAEDQPQYETLPVYIDTEDPTTPTTMCIELDKEERKQVAETGRIWITTLTFMQQFHPIKMSFLKPEGFTEPKLPARKYYFFIDIHEKTVFCAKTKKLKFKNGHQLYGEFQGFKTDSELTQPDFEKGIIPGQVISLINGEKIQVESVYWYIISKDYPKP